MAMFDRTLNDSLFSVSVLHISGDMELDGPSELAVVCLQSAFKPRSGDAFTSAGRATENPRRLRRSRAHRILLELLYRHH